MFKKLIIQIINMKNWLLKLTSIVFISFTVSACTSWKNELIQKGNYETAIKNSIFDFYHTSSLVKKNTNFIVSYKIYESGIIGVSITGNDNKIYIINGSPKGKIKDQYLEYNGKLFCWYDDQKGQNPNIINKLSKYKVIDSVKALTEDMLYVRDDAKKGANYYFCKDNLSIYKKEETSMAMPREIKINLNCIQY